MLHISVRFAEWRPWLEVPEDLSLARLARASLGKGRPPTSFSGLDSYHETARANHHIHARSGEKRATAQLISREAYKSDTTQPRVLTRGLYRRIHRDR
jgi:hypothetical protein